jgi:hypothetical protein
VKESLEFAHQREQGVTLIVIAGDIHDGADRSLKAQLLRRAGS